MSIKVPFEAKTKGAQRSIDRLHKKIGRTGTISQRSAGISSSAYRGIARAATAAAVAVGTIVGAVKGIGAADRLEGLNNRITAFSASSEEAASRMRDVIAVAKSQHQSLSAVGTLYSRMQVSARGLGVSQKLLAETSEAFAAGARITSASTQEASAAAIQFSQAMASGELRGEEFRSVMEQTPRVAIALADGLGVTTGKLREMAHAGKLTTAVVLPALNSQLAKLREESARIPPTLGELKTQFSNSFDLAASAVSKTTGALTKLKGGLSFVTGGMDKFTDTLRGGGSLGLALADSIISGITAGVDFIKKAFASVSLDSFTKNLAAVFSYGPKMLIGFFSKFKVGDLSGMISSLRAGASDFGRSLFDNTVAAFSGIDFARFGLRFADSVINSLIEVLEMIADSINIMVNKILDAAASIPFMEGRLGPNRYSENNEFEKSNLESTYKGEGNVFAPSEGGSLGVSGNPIDQFLASIQNITDEAAAARASIGNGNGGGGDDDGSGMDGQVDMESAANSASDALSGLADLTGNKVIGAMSDFAATFQSVNKLFDNFSKMLDSLGGGGGSGGFLSSLFSTEAQAGGVVVPGSGIGDKIPAMLEPGEVVIPNRQSDREELLGSGRAPITLHLNGEVTKQTERTVHRMIMAGTIGQLLNQKNIETGGSSVFRS